MNAAKSVKPGIYRHFKGGEYRVLQVARHTETQEELVVYRSLQDPNPLWVRPLAMFVEEIDRDEYSGPRFSWLREDDGQDQ